MGHEHAPPTFRPHFEHMDVRRDWPRGVVAEYDAALGGHLAPIDAHLRLASSYADLRLSQVLIRLDGNTHQVRGQPRHVRGVGHTQERQAGRRRPGVGVTAGDHHGQPGAQPLTDALPDSLHRPRIKAHEVGGHESHGPLPVGEGQCLRR